MSIRIKIKGADKAIIRWNNPMEKEWMMRNLCKIRDTNRTPIQLSIKDVRNQEIEYNLSDTATVIPHPPPAQPMIPNQGQQTEHQPIQMPPPTNPKLRPDPETMKAIEIRPETKKGDG